MKPFYEEDGIVIYHGDCREVLPKLTGIDTVLTDPVWPNASKELAGAKHPRELFAEAVGLLPQAKRLIVHLGCDSDPRILLSVAEQRWPFLRLAWLRYACPTRKGRCLYGADVAYVFGEYPKSIAGRRVISGEYVSTKPDVRRMIVTKHKEWGRALSGEHPTPRRLQHVRWLVAKWAEGLVLDPFAGSGTTLLAAKLVGYPAIGIEIEERWCEISAKRLSQKSFEFKE